MRAVSDLLLSDRARQLFSYWNSLPKINLVPDRKDFNPAAIHKLMPIVSILELVSPARVEVRLVGTDLVDRIGAEITGGNYLESLEPELRPAYLQILNTQISHPCGRRTVLKTREESGILSSVEVLSLPLTHEGTGNPLILSCFEPTESIGYEYGGRGVKGFDDVVWIDIGAGVPAA